MIDPFVLLTPVFLLAVLALLRFVGCDEVFGLERPDEVDMQNNIVTFDNTTQGGPLDGIHDSNGNKIDFGMGAWRWGTSTTDPDFIIFSSPGSSRIFRFANGPRILKTMDVHNEASSQNTITLSSGSNPSVSLMLDALAGPVQVQTITTGWTMNSQEVTVECTVAQPQLGIHQITYLGPK